MNNPLDTTLFDRAVKFATEAHQGTERRGKGYPYLLHLMEAAIIVASITTDQELLAAAMLHDVVEDTEVTLEQVRAEFGERVAELVKNETAPDSDQLSWRQRKETQLAQLVAAPYDSKVVAIGDKLSNLRTLASDYEAIGDALWSRFHAPGGKEDIAWYYRSIAEALSPLSATAPYKEYCQLLEKTF